MRLAADLREAVYLSALNGSLSERKPGEKTEQFHSSFTDEEPFSIPNNWKWCYFSDVVTIATNLVDPKEYQDYLQIAPDYIEKGTGILNPCNTVKANKIISKNHLFRAGQIIYSKIRPALRKAVIAPFDGLCSADMYPLETELNTHYLLFFLLSDFFTKKAVEKSAREKMPKINQKELGKLPIPVPPVEEQQRIVERVKELLPEINEYEEMENRLVALKEAFPGNLRDAVLQAAFKGEMTERMSSDTPIEDTLSRIREEKEKLITLGKVKKVKPLPEIDDTEIPFSIPEEWIWQRWGDIAFSIQYGYNAPAAPTGRIKMVRISDIQDNQVNWASVPFCEIPENEIETYLLAPNDILFARTGGTVGKSYIVTDVPEPAIYAGYLIRTQYSQKLVPQYLKYFMESALYWNQLRSGTKVSAQPNCNGKTLSKMILPLPPIEEQQRIVDHLNAILPMCDALVEET